MNMSGNYCGFMALSVMVVGKLRIYSACSPSSAKMDDKTLRGVCSMLQDVNRTPYKMSGGLDSRLGLLLPFSAPRFF